MNWRNLASLAVNGWSPRWWWHPGGIVVERSSRRCVEWEKTSGLTGAADAKANVEMENGGSDWKNSGSVAANGWRNVVVESSW